MLRRAISPETAATLTAIMEAVVERGTAAKVAQIEGYTVAGKTGTASKLVNRRYSKSDYNASFVGFVPSRKPALTIVVVIDSPHTNGYYGGDGVGAGVPAHRGSGAAPPRDRPDGERAAAGARRAPRLAVRRADGAARARAGGTAAPPDSTPAGEMPDLRGLSAREALRTLTRIGLTARINGDGFVIEQSPPPGAPVAHGDASRADARPAAGRAGRRRAAMTLRELLRAGGVLRDVAGR